MGIRDVRATERKLAETEGEALATLCKRFVRRRLWWAAGALAGGTLQAAMLWTGNSSRVGRRGDSYPVSALMIIAGLVILWVLWLEIGGGRDRKLVLADGRLWARRILHWDELPWDRIEEVTSIWSAVHRQPIKFGISVTTKTPRQFSVSGTNTNDEEVSVQIIARDIDEDIDELHERLLAELGRRFGDVWTDHWDATRDAKGTPAAGAARRRKERKRAEQMLRDQGIEPS